jgi:hypothetical protein
MHFHLPKPLHGWREFAGEVGIIVLGVLIALSAEQVVESIHDRQLAKVAENDIRAELAYDSAFAAERIAIGDCMRASIRDLQQRLVASGDSWPGLQGEALSGAPKVQPASSLFASAPPLGSPHRLWPTSAWSSATSSGALRQGTRNRFFKFAALYAMVNWLDKRQEAEIADYTRLMPFDVPQKLDASARMQLLTALGSVDADNADAERLAAVFVTAARRNGIPPDPAWLQRIVRQEAEHRGACVKHGPALDTALVREFNDGSRL